MRQGYQTFDGRKEIWPTPSLASGGPIKGLTLATPSRRAALRGSASSVATFPSITVTAVGYSYC